MGKENGKVTFSWTWSGLLLLHTRSFCQSSMTYHGPEKEQTALAGGLWPTFQSTLSYPYLTPLQSSKSVFQHFQYWSFNIFMEFTANSPFSVSVKERSSYWAWNPCQCISQLLLQQQMPPDHSWWLLFLLLCTLPVAMSTSVQGVCLFPDRSS